jgi:hypothetical protein
MDHYSLNYKSKSSRGLPLGVAHLQFVTKQDAKSTPKQEDVAKQDDKETETPPIADDSDDKEKESDQAKSETEETPARVQEHHECP